MKNQHFAFACLLVFAAIIGFHGLMGAYINREGSQHYEEQLKTLQEKQDLAELSAALAEEQLRDYQKQVATILPKDIPAIAASEDQYQMRQIASISRVGESIQASRGSSLFEEGKRFFRKKEFEKAAARFGKLVKEYPYSPYIVDSMFLQAESEYQLGDFIEALATIDRMVTLFPESEATGFALLRLGKIYEKQKRMEDAADIYRSILKHYPSHDVQTQAQQLLKAVEL